MLLVREIEFPPPDFLCDCCEDAQFYLAFQRAKVPGFDLGYLSIETEGKKAGIVPFFLMQYRPSMLIENDWLKKGLGWVQFRAAFVGHPSCDEGRIDGEISADMLAAVNEYLFARAELIVYKFFKTPLPLPGFIRVPGMPIPILKIGSNYFANFHGAQRKHLHREMQLGRELEFREMGPGAGDFPLAAIYSLYLNSVEHGKIGFETLNRDYFLQTRDISRFLLCYLHGELIGFAQYLQKGGMICGKYLGMDYDRGRAHGLYYALLLQMVRIAAREGCELDFGVSAYEFKIKLGCRLESTCLYFKHSNPLINRLLAAGKFLALPQSK